MNPAVSKLNGTQDPLWLCPGRWEAHRPQRGWGSRLSSARTRTRDWLSLAQIPLKKERIELDESIRRPGLP